MKILDVPRSGSYQGITSSRNRFGQYVRTRATPVNPATTFQQAVRARLTAAAQDWRALTATQREGWSSLGEFIERTDSLGQAYFLTGFQAFVLVRNNLAAAGDAALTDAPAYAPPDPLLSVTPTISAASVSIAYTPTPLGAGERAFISMSPPRSAGRAFEGDVRLISVTAAAAASPASILAAYQGRFGTPVTGERIFVVIQRYKGGFLSTPLITSTIVT
jgi:hypothetical protein